MKVFLRNVLVIILGLLFSIMLHGCSHTKGLGTLEEKPDLKQIMQSYQREHNAEKNNLSILGNSIIQWREKRIREEGNWKVYFLDIQCYHGNGGDFCFSPYVEDRKFFGWLAAEIRNGKTTFMMWTNKLPEGWRFLPEAGQSADIISTSVGILGNGLVEANPVAASLIESGGIPLFSAVKIGTAYYFTKRSGLEACYKWGAPLASVGSSLGAWNLLLASGAGAPVAMVAGVAVGANVWPDVSERFWACIPQGVFAR